MLVPSQWDEYLPGSKLPAFLGKAARKNERNEIVIKNKKLTVQVNQIAGVLARRIVQWKHPGTDVALGEKIGMIKFGSRTQLSIPAHVPFDVKVRVGDRVQGGATVLGVIREAEER